MDDADDVMSSDELMEEIRTSKAVRDARKAALEDALAAVTAVRDGYRTGNNGGGTPRAIAHRAVIAIRSLMEADRGK